MPALNGRAFQAVDKPLCFLKMGSQGRSPPYRSSAICATASCSGFVRLTASILAWSGAVAPAK